MQYWFNISTRKVEAHDDPGRARAESLMGPYASQEEAQAALEKAASRTEQWDEQDRKDDAWDKGDPDAEAWDNNPLNG
jgi:hypothetical protein